MPRTEENLNFLNPLVRQQDQFAVEHANQDITFDLLLQPNFYDNQGPQPNDGYRPAKIVYNYEEGEYAFKFADWAEQEEDKMVIKDTKPYTLRSVHSRSGTVDGRLYVFHNIAPKDESMAKTSVKTPVRIMDFSKQKLFIPQFLNDDSTGNKRGEEDEKKDTYLPLAFRINYSLCAFKNRLFMYGGLNQNNEVLNTMESFDTAILKFQTQKFRGDLKPVGRQGHQAVVMN